MSLLFLMVFVLFIFMDVGANIWNNFLILPLIAFYASRFYAFVIGYNYKF